MDDWESIPLFAPEGAAIPRVDENETAEGVSPALGALSHLLYDEETPEEISELERDFGNRLFRRGRRYYKAAIEKYTKAIEVNCEIPEVTAAAYSNRAAAELKLKNYGRALADSEACLRLQPDNLKAMYRAAIAATAIMRFDDAMKHCNTALQTVKDGEQKVLFQKTKSAAEEARKREMESLERAEKKKSDADIAAATRRKVLNDRGITMGMPLFSQQRSYNRKEPVIEGDKVYWPLLLLYPEEAIGVQGAGDQSDYLEEVSDDATLGDVIATVFPPGGTSPDWDRRGAYRDYTQLEVLYRQGWTLTEDEADSDDERSYVGSSRGPDEVGTWRTISQSLTLREAITTRDYIVPKFPVFYCVPKGTYLS